MLNIPHFYRNPVVPGMRMSGITIFFDQVFLQAPFIDGKILDVEK